MKRGPTGYYFPVSTLGETCRAFVPHPLPPNPPLDLDEELLTGVRDTATQATGTASRMLALFKTDHDRVSALGRSAGTAVRVHHFLQTQPLTTIARLSEALHVAPHTIGQSLDRLSKLGITRETTGGKYGRVFAYTQYVAILTEGT